MVVLTHTLDHRVMKGAFKRSPKRVRLGCSTKGAFKRSPKKTSGRSRASNWYEILSSLKFATAFAQTITICI